MGRGAKIERRVHAAVQHFLKPTKTLINIISSLRTSSPSSPHCTPQRPCRHRMSHHRREATPSKPVHRRCRRREPNHLSRFSSLFLLEEAAGSLYDHRRERRWRSVYDHRCEHRCCRCSTIPFRKKGRCATTLSSSPPCQPPRLGLQPSCGHTSPFRASNRRRRGRRRGFLFPYSSMCYD